MITGFVGSPERNEASLARNEGSLRWNGASSRWNEPSPPWNEASLQPNEACIRLYGSTATESARLFAPNCSTGSKEEGGVTSKTPFE